MYNNFFKIWWPHKSTHQAAVYLLKFVDLVYLHAALFMYQSHSNTLPTVFNGLFSSVSKRHYKHNNTHLASSHSSFCLPKIRTMENSTSDLMAQKVGMNSLKPSKVIVKAKSYLKPSLSLIWLNLIECFFIIISLLPCLLIVVIVVVVYLLIFIVVRLLQFFFTRTDCYSPLWPFVDTYVFINNYSGCLTWLAYQLFQASCTFISVTLIYSYLNLFLPMYK